MSVLVGQSPGLIAAARDPLLGFRHGQDWRVDLLDTSDRLVGELDGVMSGELTFSIHTEIRSSGSLTVGEPGLTDWHRVRLQITYVYRDETGTTHEHPLGVFLPTTSDTAFDGHGSTAPVDLYDKMALLVAGGVASWTVDAGTTIADAVAAVLAEVGETRISAPDDGGGELRNQMTWEPGTTRLRIVNDLLEAGGFFSIWVDGTGVWQLTPYVEPARRGVAWTHEEGPAAVFEEEFSHESDGWDVVNHVIITGRSDDEETPAPFAEARNEDPSDPFSVPARGYEITHEEADQDATTVAVLGQIAARRLLDLSSVTSTYTISHDYLPIDLNSAVRLRVPSEQIDALCVFQAWSWSWDASDDEGPGMVQATLREVKE